MSKPTRTINPIHFEDLDPKRFEDLVRELIYDFRDWKTIEATGKGGDDDGFDIRAYERASVISFDDEGNEVLRPMDGNLWMIQCKREKVISPSKIEKILGDIDDANPPYGYMLVAATNFSKKSYDKFREILTSKGVMEFYLWGSATIETELYQPKNDRILFTFFGISNVSRKRSRSTEIRSEVINKNKIMRLFGDSPKHKWFLARDASDINYPYDSKYKDFDKYPRWKEYEIVEYHPLGLIVQLKYCYAYFDEKEQIFDYKEPSIGMSNPNKQFRYDENDTKERDIVARLRDYWECLPNSNKAMFHSNGIIRFKDMMVIDDKGDNINNFPHLFVDFINGSPITGSVSYLEHGGEQIGLEKFKRKDIFPKDVPQLVFGTIYEKDGLSLPSEICQDYLNYRGGDIQALYDVEGRFAHLMKFDVAVVRHPAKEERFLQVTHVYEISGSELLHEYPDKVWQVQRQIGRPPTAGDTFRVLEVRNCYRHQWERG